MSVTFKYRVSGGRAPSPRYREVAAALRPHGLLPGEYVREMRQEGAAWATIAATLAADIETSPPSIWTLQYWERIESHLGGEWVGFA